MHCARYTSGAEFYLASGDIYATQQHDREHLRPGLARRPRGEAAEGLGRVSADADSGRRPSPKSFRSSLALLSRKWRRRESNPRRIPAESLVPTAWPDKPLRRTALSEELGLLRVARPAPLVGRQRPVDTLNPRCIREAFGSPLRVGSDPRAHTRIVTPADHRPY
jgi:hypothetical protein